MAKENNVEIDKNAKIEKKPISLEEKRLIELRNKMSEKIEDVQDLDEYVKIYMTLVLSYASTLNINFDNLKE
tara:strand:+ start:1090 stop:1305 length:216 start_codon:yes stop_codon:yes gene_type:complete